MSVRLPVTEWWLWLSVAVATAAPYLFLVPGAAPRFLLPAYALLALPAAFGLGTGASRTDPVPTHAGIRQRARGDRDRIASVLRELGVHPPCVLAGTVRRFSSPTFPVPDTHPGWTVVVRP